MNIKILRWGSLALIAAGILVACQKEEITPQPETSTAQPAQAQKRQMTKIGEHLQNPYSVANMQQALDNLKSGDNKALVNEIEVRKTHLYVRFKPQNETELSILQSDRELELYTYPLDVEILEKGDYYHDPEIPEDQPTYQYCAVPVDQALPEGVAYEVLAELYIPDDFSDDREDARWPTVAAANALVEEALRLTDNLPDPDETVNTGSRGSKWRPAGRIRVYDDKTNSWVGVNGIEVRANRWFTTHTGWTNSAGNFTCNGTFKNDANYSLKWERYHYSIRSGATGQAKLDGPKKRGDWNHDISDNSLQQFYAIIHTGAHVYYYGSILGLKRPPLNSTWKPQMKIGAFDKDGRANHNDDRRFLGIANQVKMYRKSGTTIRSFESLYTTTMHELAHASHWELRKGEWDNGKTSDKLQESWAMGVAWSLVRLRYPSHNWWATVTFNWMTTDGENQYTPLVMDLIDNSNQGASTTSRPYDRVSGYTISQIEDVLEDCDDIMDLRDELRTNYANSTEIYLNELFDQYDRLAR